MNDVSYSRVATVICCLILLYGSAAFGMSPAPIVYVSGNGSGDFNCDGVDDHVQINQALSFVASNPSYTTVYLKGPFRYVINDTLMLSNNIILEGDSTAVLTIIDNNSWPSQKPMISQSKASSGRIIIRGFEIDGNYKGNTHKLRGKGFHNFVHIYYADVEIYNMYLHDSHGDGLKVKYSNNVKFHDNRIYKLGHDSLFAIQCQNVEAWNNNVRTMTNSALRAWNSNHIKFYNNEIYTQYEPDAGGPGIQVQYIREDKAQPMNDIEIYNNNIHDTYGPGIWLIALGKPYTKDEAKNVHIHHNIFARCGTHPSYDWLGGIVTSGFYDTLIENNVFDGNYHAAVAYIYPTPPRFSGLEPNGTSGKYTTIMRNNIIVNTIKRKYLPEGTGAGVMDYYPETHTFILDNNCLYNNVGGNYVNATSNSTLNANPLFADPTHLDYHLKSKAGRWNGTTWVVDDVHSPCIDAGYPSASYSNEPADNGKRINIGLYGNTQYASKSVRQLQITAPTTDGTFVSGTYQVQVGNIGEYLNTTDSAKLYIGDTVAAVDTEFPYTFAWDTTALADGTYSLLATGTLKQVGGPSYSLVRSVYVDNTPPMVTITNPGLAPISGIYQVTATASDANGVKEVHFLLDDVLLGTDDSAPYAYAWNTTTASDRKHTLTARAVDMAGNTKDASVNVLVNNSGAIFYIESPIDEAFVKGMVPISIAATGLGLITKVQFIMGDTLLGEDTSAPYSVAWDTNAVADGSYTITVNVTDDASNVTSQSITVTVDNTAPTLQITTPADGATVKGTVAISATASDSNGITSVRFQVGNLTITDNSAPYSVNWDTTKFDNGAYIINVTATDAASNETSASVSITVENVSVTTDAIGHGPNPASTSVTFYFNDVSGTLRVYDISGRLVWNKPILAGTKSVSWNLYNTAGRPLANGLYLYMVVFIDGKVSAPQQLVITR